VTLDPNGIATARYEPAKAGCIRVLAVESCPCSSRFAHNARRQPLFVSVFSPCFIAKKRRDVLTAPSSRDRSAIHHNDVAGV